jgi:hypothetical protein
MIIFFHVSAFLNFHCVKQVIDQVKINMGFSKMHGVLQGWNQVFFYTDAKS